jgi:hypothetical protein
MIGTSFFIAGLLLYFLPSIIAAKKRNAAAIIILNVLLGWTLIGWIVAFVWALAAESETQAVLALPASHWCSACRAPISAGQRFCQSCGVSIAWPPALHS